MNPKHKLKCMKYSAILGAILSILPLGLYMYWGNMSVYSLSYIVNAVQSTSDVNTPWTLSIFLVFLSLGMNSTFFITNLIGLRLCVLVGALIADVGLFCSYFAVQTSAMALTCTLGVVMGFGTGLANNGVLQLVVEWADNDVGRLTALIQSGFCFGGVLINEFVTLYTNPQDLAPDMKLGRAKFFSQKEILDRVPSMFLIHGSFSVTMHIVGLWMLRKKPKVDPESQEECILEMDRLALGSSNYTTGCKTNNGKSTDNPIPTAKLTTTSMSTLQRREDNSVRRDLHPKEMLKTVSFYIIWIAFFIGDVPLLLLNNYYKSYGQLWIHNDHFLTVLGTLVIFLNTFASVLWGVCMDRFGVKKCLAALLYSVVIIQSWYYFTPMVNKWMYFVATLVFGCTADPLYPCLTAATALLYGKTHFSTNFGIVMTANTALNVIAPFMLESLLSQLGWFAIFAFGSACTLTSLILILSFIPRI